ncbi:efflux RND transporter periplasmic adaptor subunit [Rhodanobacter lindaniclasticus]
MRRGTPAIVSSTRCQGDSSTAPWRPSLPDIDATTRTQRARIVLDNADGALSPGMFATVQLNPTPNAAVPVVPDDALIATGTHTRVILAEGDGHFRAVSVRIGRAAGGYTEILDGLSGGEKVVVSGQFLIDSEGESVPCAGTPE